MGNESMPPPKYPISSRNLTAESGYDTIDPPITEKRFTRTSAHSIPNVLTVSKRHISKGQFIKKNM